MEFRPIARTPDSFQQSVTAEQVLTMCRQAFGDDAVVASAVELGTGMYNNTYRVDFESVGPVILRVAPEPSRQSRIERELMRNEHAAVPFLAPIAPLMPQTLMVDFTHEAIGRDYLFQTMLAGVPAPDKLGEYPRSAWGPFFRQLGAISRRIHSVRGSRFGSVAGPSFSAWSEAVEASFADLIADLHDNGLVAEDVGDVAAFAEERRSLFDEITQPRLLHGDLWTVNVMLCATAPEPTITGVFDCDRVSWGDPAADWALFMAGRRPGAERDAFRDGYRSLPSTVAVRKRALFYAARHVGAIRLERHRRGAANVAGTYDDMAAILTKLRT